MSPERILVVVAHADDEVLGVGGTIARCVSEGKAVHLLVLADGVSSRKYSSEIDLERRVHASKCAQSILGISSCRYFDLQDNKMDSVPLLEIVRLLEPVMAELQPSIIYTHHHGDLNVDHRLTHAAVLTACRPIPRESVREIYGFEVLSSTEWATPQELPFTPNFFVDISEYLQTKIKALSAYESEMREVPHSRSLEHVEVLARHRGYTIGVDAAEAFVVYRIIR